MKIAIAFICIAIISYFVGTINFARIIAWGQRRKDITKLGSGNPGTMNMFRSLGVAAAVMTLLAEVVKAGLTCLICKLCMGWSGYGELAFYVSGFFIVLGSDYPIFFKFKGGKGVGCLVGMFAFSPMWYMAIIFFIIGLISVWFTDIGALSSFEFITGMSVAVTVYSFVTHTPFAWLITLIVWLLWALTMFKHRSNLKRLVQGKENKMHFKDQIQKAMRKRKQSKDVKIVPEDRTDAAPEVEIVVEDEAQDCTNQMNDVSEPEIVVEDETKKSIDGTGDSDDK